MGKMANRVRDPLPLAEQVFIQGLLEFAQLWRRKRVKEALQEHDGFPEASIQVVVIGIQGLPTSFQRETSVFTHFLNRCNEVAGQILG